MYYSISLSLVANVAVGGGVIGPRFVEQFYN